MELFPHGRTFLIRSEQSWGIGFVPTPSVKLYLTTSYTDLAAHSVTLLEMRIRETEEK